MSIINFRRKKFSKAEPVITIFLKERQKKLKKYNDLNTTNSIVQTINTRIKNNKILYENDEKITNYYFFITTLGIIDSKINKLISDINFHTNTNINNIKEEIELAEETTENLLLEREIIVSNYKEYTNDEDPIINEIIADYPAYEKFNSLYDEQIENPSSLKTEAVNAYNEGYLHSKCVTIPEIIEQYKNLYEDLHNNKIKNEEKISQTKNKVKQYKK